MKRLKVDKYDCSGVSGYSRICHSSVVLGSEILLVGGEGASHENSPGVLRLDCRNFRFSYLPHRSLPKLQNHQMFALGESCYGWGGTAQLYAHENGAPLPFGDFYKFDEGNSYTYEQLGTVPYPRIYHRIVSVGIRHALLYGGIANNTILNDWYLFDSYDHSWRQCKLSGSAPQEPLHLPTLCWAYDRGYLFGGQMHSLNHIPRYSRDLYEVRVDNFLTAYLRFQRLYSEDGPAGRSRHSSVCYQGKYLFVACGEGLAEDEYPNSYFAPKLFCDVWIYNIEMGGWSKCELSVGPRAGSSIHVCDNKLFMLGGAKSLHELCTDMEIINLEPDNLNQLVCGLCQTTYSISRVPYLAKCHDSIKRCAPEMSIEFVDGMAQLIQFPFHAIGLLIDNSFNMGASYVLINLQSRNGHLYLDISDNSRQFTHKQFMDAIWKFNIRRGLELSTRDAEDILLEAEYGLNLKLGGLRIGRSMLFISKNEYDTHIAFLSSLDIYQPHAYHPIILQYSVSRRKSPLTVEYRLHRKLIIQACKHILHENEFVQIEDNYSRAYKRIIVFELRNWKVGQTVHHELERELTDVRNASRKDVQKLDIELSLKSYISHLYLAPYMGRSIYLQDQLVRPINYDEAIKRIVQQKGLKWCDTDSKLQHRCNKLRLVRISELHLTPELQGILLYHDNRLFGVASRQLGSHSSCKEALRWAGVVYIPHEVQLNVIKTDIESLVERCFLESELKRIFSYERYPSYFKRERQHIIEDESRILKKHNRSERF